jgi:prepilin-type N-terminal cleavage/methylation domain-containing protein
MSKKANAFTLVEILVVILIIGLLFVFLVPKISNSTDKAREVGIKTTFHSYETAFESVMKERSGLGKNSVTDSDTLVGYVNGYLDPALQINVKTGSKDGASAITPVAAGNAGSAVVDNNADEIYLTEKKDPWNNQYVFVCSLSAGTDTTTANKNDGIVMVYTIGKDAKPTMQITGIKAVKSALTDSDTTNDANLGLSVGDGKDDYALACAYVDGVEYTATVGFSTDIAAK